MNRLILLVVTAVMSATLWAVPTKESGALNRKGLRLLRLCGQQSKDKNALLSPFSIDSAFSMLWLGSRGETRDEIAAVLGLPDSPHFLSQANREFASSREPEILPSNSIWVDRHTPLAKRYSYLVAHYFPRAVFDFDNTDRQGTANRVNAFIKEKTKGLIPELLTKKDIRPYRDPSDRGTGLIFLNTIYFKGQWQEKFKSNNVEHDFDFNRLDGQAEKVEMMRDTRTTGYAEGADYQVLSLPYSSAAESRCDFVVVLPTPALAVEKLLERLEQGDAFAESLASIRSRKVRIWLPKIDVKSRSSLKDTLDALGMKRAFTSHRDSYPAITEGKDGVYVDRVDDVLHAVRIKLDENGTEAAAATAIMIAMSKCAEFDPEPPIPVFRADHPFLGFIVNRETGLILFAGMFRTLGKDAHPAPDAADLEAREAKRRLDFAAEQRGFDEAIRNPPKHQQLPDPFDIDEAF